MTSFPSIPVSSPAPLAGSRARRRAMVGLGALFATLGSGHSLQAANATRAAAPANGIGFVTTGATNWSAGDGAFREDNTVQTGSELSIWAAIFTGAGASSTVGAVVLTDTQDLAARRFLRLGVTH